MTLGELIKRLITETTHHPGKRCSFGIIEPHYYWGNCEQLAFEIGFDISVDSMFKRAVAAIGREFQGYKGGFYKMDLDTNVFLARYGDCGIELSHEILNVILGNEVPSDNGDVFE